MSVRKDFKAGWTNVNKFTLTPHSSSSKQIIDLKELLASINLTESIYTGFESGNAVVVDTIDALHSFPFLGEENLDLSYTDSFGKTIESKYKIYSITNVKRVDDRKGFSYKLHFVSAERFNSYQFLDTSFYEGKVSSCIKDVFDNYYNVNNKKIHITETDDNIQFLAPNVDPQITMQHLSKRASSVKDTSQSFRFFENRNGFWFTTIEYLLAEYDKAKNPIIITNTNILSEPDVYKKIEISSRTPVSSSVDSQVNTIDDISSGAYYSIHSTLDFMNNRVLDSDYNYYDSKNKYYGPLKYHKKNYATDIIRSDRVRYWRIPNVKDDPDGEKIQKDKFASEYHRHSFRGHLVLPGRNDIFAGSILDIRLKGYNGLFLVENVETVFGINNFNIGMNISLLRSYDNASV